MAALTQGHRTTIVAKGGGELNGHEPHVCTCRARRFIAVWRRV
ncbi:hypothetical protein [Microbacterium sp.]|nr:hypothetical protein [Microbacterium sp.]